MSADELAGFLAARPRGAICAVDDDGRLVATPARVLDAHDGILRVEVPDAALASAFTGKCDACVVADVFETYDGIRGVIAGGPAATVGSGTAHLMSVEMVRVATFSFAEKATKPDAAQPD
jgi:hypothetical protein